MTNIEKCLAKIKDIHPVVETEEQLWKYLTFMPDEDRDIFEAKWGIDASGTYCETYDELDKKLNLKNSKNLYLRSLCELDFSIFKCSYASIIQNYEANIELAFCYGIFLAHLSGNYVHPEKIPPLNSDLIEIRKRCEKAFSILTHLEKSVIVTKYGLEDSRWCKADKVVSSILGISDISVIRALNRAFSKFEQNNTFKMILEN